MPTTPTTVDTPTTDAPTALEVGSDQTTYGTVTIGPDGKFVYAGDYPEQVQYFTEFYAEKLSNHSESEEYVTPEAILQYMDARMNGRTWARPVGGDEEEEPNPVRNAEPAPTGGHWVTTDAGNHIYIKGGKVVIGNPHVVAAATGGHADAKAPAPKAEEPKAPAPASSGGGTGKSVGGHTPMFTGKEDRVKAEAHAKTTHGEWGKSLPPEQKKALRDYSDDKIYKQINGGLRDTKGEAPAAHADTVKHLDAAIASAPPTKEDMLLYRGIDHINAKKLAVGSEFTDHGYTSTTHNYDTAESFGGDAIIHMTVPKGTRAAAMDATGAAIQQGAKSENEYLLPRGTKYKVTHKSKDSDGLDIYHVTVLHG